MFSPPMLNLILYICPSDCATGTVERDTKIVLPLPSSTGTVSNGALKGFFGAPATRVEWCE